MFDGHCSARRVLFSSCVVAFMTAPGAGAHAQDDAAPAESAAPEQQQPSRWAAALDLGFTSSSGNTQLTALTTGLRIRHLQTRLFKLDWSISYRYGESSGEVVARHAQSKLDFDMGTEARYAPFISASAERDPFRRLDLRSRTGTGVRYAFYRGERGEGAVRVALLYSHERFTGVAQPARTDGTFSFELRTAQQIGDAVRLENTSSYDPVMDDFGDYGLDVKSKLSSKISRRLALTVAHALTYDSTPAPEVERFDQRLQAGLTIEF